MSEVGFEPMPPRGDCDLNTGNQKAIAKIFSIFLVYICDCPLVDQRCTTHRSVTRKTYLHFKSKWVTWVTAKCNHFFTVFNLKKTNLVYYVRPLLAVNHNIVTLLTGRQNNNARSGIQTQASKGDCVLRDSDSVYTGSPQHRTSYLNMIGGSFPFG